MCGGWSRGGTLVWVSLGVTRLLQGTADYLVGEKFG